VKREKRGGRREDGRVEVRKERISMIILIMDIIQIFGSFK
jgi:hypothetical protein